MKKIDKIITIIKEMMVANPPGTSGGFTSSGDPKYSAGFDPLLQFKNKNKNTVDFRRVPKKYKDWVKYLKK
jgi:hypothetical protein